MMKYIALNNMFMILQKYVFEKYNFKKNYLGLRARLIGFKSIKNVAVCHEVRENINNHSQNGAHCHNGK